MSTQRAKGEPQLLEKVESFTVLEPRVSALEAITNRVIAFGAVGEKVSASGAFVAKTSASKTLTSRVAAQPATAARVAASAAQLERRGVGQVSLAPVGAALPLLAMSLEFDNTNATRLQSSADDTLFDFGFPNDSTHQFSLMVWAKSTGTVTNGALPHPGTLISFGAPSAAPTFPAVNTFSIQDETDTGTVLIFFESATGGNKTWLTVPDTTPRFSSPGWYNLVVTFNGELQGPSGDEIKIYVNGVLATIASKPKNGEPFQPVNQDMFGSFGNFHIPSSDLPGKHFIYSVGTWDSELLAAEVTALAANSQLDIRFNSGDYVSAANNKGFYPVGRRPSPNLGDDIGVVNVNLNTEIDIGDGDRSADIPGSL